MSELQTVSALLKDAQTRLATVSGELARRDAEIMLSSVLGISTSRLPLFDEPVSQEQLTRFEGHVGRRITGEPVAYIVGEQEFWSLTFKVNEHTLVPRPDTETLVEVGLRSLPGSAASSILDLGTGSGCILLSILYERPNGFGVGIDMSPGALDVAKTNAERLELAERSEFKKGDWFSPVDDAALFDLIVSNPPYIETDDMQTLMSDVRDYEPATALDGGEDGLQCYRRITADATSFLVPGGTLAVEIGIGQESAVSRLFEDAGLVDVSIHADLAGVNRVVAAKKANDS